PPAPKPMTLPAVLDDSHLAGRFLDDYFVAPRSDGHGPLFTGGRFERLGGGGDRVEFRNVITAEDLAAASLLNVNVPARAALAILEPGRDVVTDLLADIPADVDLVDADDATIGRR